MYTTQIDIDAYLKSFQKLCETTSLSNMNSTIIIIWIFRSVLIEANNFSNTDLLSKLEERIFILIRFHNLLFNGNYSIQQSNSINLKYIFNQGKGVLTEILAKQIVLNKYPPKLLTFADSEDDSSEENVEAEVKDNLKLLLQNSDYRAFYGIDYHIMFFVYCNYFTVVKFLKIKIHLRVPDLVCHDL